MTAFTPQSMVARSVAAGSHFYGQGSGTLLDVVGRQLAGTLLVAVCWGGQGVNSGGLLYAPVLQTAPGGVPQTLVNFTTASTAQQASDLFTLSWAYVPAAGANDTTLRVATQYSSGPGVNLVADTQIFAFSNADPAVFPVGAATPDGGWSTPTFTPPFDGLGVHVLCQQDYGQSVVYDPFGEIALGPFGTAEFDGNVPLQVTGSSALTDAVAGVPLRTVPQTYNPAAPPPFGWGSGQDPSTHIRAAVIVLPLKRGDSCGDLVT